MKLSRAPSRERYEICVFFAFTAIYFLTFFSLKKFLSVSLICGSWVDRGKKKNEEKEDSEMAMTINLSLTRLLFMEPFVNVIKFEVLFAASVRDSLTFCAFF